MSSPIKMHNLAGTKQTSRRHSQTDTAPDFTRPAATFIMYLATHEFRAAKYTIMPSQKEIGVDSRKDPDSIARIMSFSKRPIDSEQLGRKYITRYNLHQTDDVIPENFNRWLLGAEGKDWVTCGHVECRVGECEGRVAMDVLKAIRTEAGECSVVVEGWLEKTLLMGDT
ncbi:hypothetical protein CC86DRAFT_406643 [Ophiobolus disseminans]|uniref:Uncharacterized protein n=1 Tax=Ophiobolus disseminans TaxID=1469910 RepID=A0A6A7A1E0_9PLEO|nr:hypothetical protein CC86DRAFT_406643 [Ophiobolus disseminans]